MTHGLVMEFPAPIELYDALHAEIGRRAPGGADGLLLHVGRATRGGFEVLEILESKEQCDRYFAAVVWPAVDFVSGDQAPSGGRQKRTSSRVD